MTKTPILTKSISSLLLSAALSGSAHAASATWLGTADSLWGNDLNWSASPVPGTGDIATFNNAGSLNTTLNLGAGVTVNSILFDSASVGPYTIGSGGIGSQTLTLDNGGGVTINGTVSTSQTFNSNLLLGNDGSTQTFSLTNDSIAVGQLLTIAGSITGSTGAGIKTVAFGGAGNTRVTGVIGNGTTGSVALTKTGTGALTLSGVNTYTGGVTLDAGTLNLNSAAALGNTANGVLVINGGTIDNTSGAAIITSAAKAMSWNGDFTFAGTNNLSTNLGAVTFGGATGQRTVTVNNGTLSTGLWTAGAGRGLTKAGAGILFMASTLNTSNIAGPLDIQGGRVQIAGDLTIGGLTGSGTLENGGAASKWFFVNNAVDNTFSGTIRDNPTGGTTVRLGLVKRGAGTLHLTGANNTFTDNFAIDNGMVRMTGTNTTGAGGSGQAQIGTQANLNGILFIDGGTFNANRTTFPSINIGTAADTRGFLRMPTGSLNSANEMWVGGGLNAFGAFTMNGGTANVGNWFAVGRDGVGIVNLSGGTLNVTGANFTNGSFANGYGVTNLTGGTINVTNTAADQGGFLVGEAGGGNLNISGGAALNISGARGLHLAIGGGTGIVNLNAGGTIATPRVQQGSSTGIFNFNGGTLKANASNPNFMQGLVNAFVHSGGATIDTNGNAITIAQSLLAPDGSGLTAIEVLTGGAGYIDTPVVRITGGSGIGATAVANLSGGVITGFTITNAGTGYIPGDILTVTLTGGGATTPATTGAVTFAENISGGLTKTGSNTLTLLGANTYTGQTTINNGTLALGTSEVLGTGNLVINGASAVLALDVNSETVGTVTLDGGGIINGTGILTSTAGFELKNGSASATLDGPIALNKTTGGTVSLAGANSFTGATNITEGTLALTGAGSINTTSGITINGSGAKLVQSSSVNITPTVIVTNGTLDGTATVDAAVVGDGTGGAIANGNGTASTLTIGNLTFNGVGAANLILNNPATSAVTISSTLTLGAVNAAGKVTVNATNSNGLWVNGQTYRLISYSTLSGAGFGGFLRGTIAGLGARQSATLTNSAGFIGLVIAGDQPFWTGAQSGAWTTAILPNPKNWRLLTAGTGTDFINGDSLLFNDNATGTTTINIPDGNVNITSAIFDNSTKSYTISSGSGFGISGGFLTKNGSGSVTINTANTYTGGTTLNTGTLILTGNNNFGTGGITINGGTATISGANTYTGATNLNLGTLNINNASALGTSNLVLSGGTIDNTSGGLVTLTGITQTWQNGAAVTFAGTNSLNLGTGAVTFGSDATESSFTLTNNSISTLTVGGSITPGAGGVAGVKTLNVVGSGNVALTGNLTVGPSLGLVVTDTGTGTLTLSGAANNFTTLNLDGGASDILEIGTGNLGLANGGGNILQSLTGSVINASGGGAIVPGGNGGDFGTAGGTTLTVNARISGASGVDFFNANAGDGLGRIILAAANDYTGATNIENTRVVIPASGAINAANTANIGQITVGDLASVPAVLDLDGGTINATKASVPSFVVSSVSGAVAAVNQSGGSINSTSEFWVGSAAGAYGAFTMSGGSVVVGNWLAVGRNGNGILNVNGGTLTVTGANYTNGSFGGANGETNLKGGTVNVTNVEANQGGFLVAEAGNGTLNISGTAALNISGARGLHVGINGGTGIVNLNGGTVTTPIVQQGASTGMLNFDGGTLKASGNSATFLQGLTSAYINDGGAVIDDGGFAITVAQPLLAPAGSGISTIAAFGGPGFIGAPQVRISGDGTGATAVANIDANGNLVGVTVTNPGVNYTDASFVSVVFDGGGAEAFLDSLELALNTSGGLTKKGTGTLTLSGINTYTGETAIDSGTLALTGSISASTSIHVKAGSTFDVAGVAGGFAVVTGQTLKGSGTVVGATTIGAGATLSPGSSPGTLTTASLSLDPDSTSVFELTLGNFTVGGGVNDLVVVNGDFTLDGTLMITEIGGFVPNGTYTLFDYSGTLIDNGLTVDPAFLALHPNTVITIDTENSTVLVTIPEPGAIASLIGGIGLLLGMQRRRRA